MLRAIYNRTYQNPNDDESSEASLETEQDDHSTSSNSSTDEFITEKAVEARQRIKRRRPTKEPTDTPTSKRQKQGNFESQTRTSTSPQLLVTERNVNENRQLADIQGTFTPQRFFNLTGQSSSLERVITKVQLQS